MIYTADDLDAFVAKSDELGGLHSPQVGPYWAGFEYRPRVVVDQRLDPFSQKYFEQQVALYREISGREIDPEKNELFEFPHEDLVHATNPVGIRHMSIAMHYARLSQVLVRANLPHAPRILDMGAGWGLSSEFLATLGARVTAVDINPIFVELIRRRQARNGLDIEAVRGTFDDFEPNLKYDAVLFYECLHHAMRPWDLIERSHKWLCENGQVLFAGEPVGGPWWKHWGLRLDAMSVYCIRKFGWFESGWSKEFISECFWRAGFAVEFSDSPDPLIGPVCVATRIGRDQQLSPTELLKVMTVEGCDLGSDYLTARGSVTARMPRLQGADFVEFAISNFRPKPIDITVTSGADKPFRVSAQPGGTWIRCRLTGGQTLIRFDAPTWIPAEEIGNHDRRSISFHIAGARLAGGAKRLAA